MAVVLWELQSGTGIIRAAFALGFFFPGKIWGQSRRGHCTVLLPCLGHREPELRQRRFPVYISYVVGCCT